MDDVWVGPSFSLRGGSDRSVVVAAAAAAANGGGGAIVAAAEKAVLLSVSVQSWSLSLVPPLSSPPPAEVEREDESRARDWASELAQSLDPCRSESIVLSPPLYLSTYLTCISFSCLVLLLLTTRSNGTTTAAFHWQLVPFTFLPTFSFRSSAALCRHQEAQNVVGNGKNKPSLQDYDDDYVVLRHRGPLIYR